MERNFYQAFLREPTPPSLLAGEDSICYSIIIVMSRVGAIQETPLRFFL